MGSTTPITTADSASRARMWLGLALLFAGFMGHFLAARAIGGTHLAYRDHLVGFFGLTLISAAIVGGLGWKFWKGRHDITILAIGIVQAAIGLLVYMQRFSVHG
jgi:hypothetical protein